MTVAKGDKGGSNNVWWLDMRGNYLFWVDDAYPDDFYDWGREGYWDSRRLISVHIYEVQLYLIEARTGYPDYIDMPDINQVNASYEILLYDTGWEHCTGNHSWSGVLNKTTRVKFPVDIERVGRDSFHEIRSVSQDNRTDVSMQYKVYSRLLANCTWDITYYSCPPPEVTDRAYPINIIDLEVMLLLATITVACPILLLYIAVKTKVRMQRESKDEEGIEPDGRMKRE